MEDKYTALLAKVDRLEESRRESDRLPFEGTSLCPVDTTKVRICYLHYCHHIDQLQDHIAVLKTERDKAVADERKASRALADLKKQFESQELVSRKKATNYMYMYVCIYLYITFIVL